MRTSGEVVTVEQLASPSLLADPAVGPDLGDRLSLENQIPAATSCVHYRCNQTGDDVYAQSIRKVTLEVLAKSRTGLYGSVDLAPRQTERVEEPVLMSRGGPVVPGPLPSDNSCPVGSTPV